MGSIFNSFNASSFFKVHPSVCLLSIYVFHFGRCASDSLSLFSLEVHGHVYYPVFVFHFARGRILIHIFLFTQDQASVILTRHDCKQLPGSSNNADTAFIKSILHTCFGKRKRNNTNVRTFPNAFPLSGDLHTLRRRFGAKFGDTPTYVNAVVA
jgi:hypothetical protein